MAPSNAYHVTHATVVLPINIANFDKNGDRSYQVNARSCAAMASSTELKFRTFLQAAALRVVQKLFLKITHLAGFEREPIKSALWRLYWFVVRFLKQRYRTNSCVEVHIRGRPRSSVLAQAIAVSGIGVGCCAAVYLGDLVFGVVGVLVEVVIEQVAGSVIAIRMGSSAVGISIPT